MKPNKDCFKINIHISVTIESLPTARPAASVAAKRTALHSSVIASVGYDPVALELDIEFVSGRVYRYSHVPSWRYEELIEAASPGRCFTYYIRDKYTTREITR